jgi:hypothetical protein
MRRRAAPLHAAPARRSLRRVSGRRTAALAASVLVLVGVPVLVVLLASNDTAAGPPVSAVGVPAGADPHRPPAPFFADAGDGVRPDGIGCTNAPGTAVRARVHLDVFADGRPVAVPGGVGVRPTCAYWVRTEAPGGVIVIGSPQRRSFTLGDFFDIWGAPLTAGRLLSFRLGAGRPLRAFVDGQRASGDPRAIALRDGREIALVAGRRPAKVPARFAFDRGG